MLAGKRFISVSTPLEDYMADRVKSPATLLDKLAALDFSQRHEVATTLRQVAETFAEVPDDKATSHVLGVLAHLLDTG